MEYKVGADGWSPITESMVPNYDFAVEEGIIVAVRYKAINGGIPGPSREFTVASEHIKQ